MMAAMLDRVRRWFLRHWFAGVFAIIGGLWLVTTIAYALGMSGISVGNRYTGQRATIDFQRGYDHPVLALADGVGLEIDHGHGSVIAVKPGLPIVCWVCGDLARGGGIGLADHRQGDWFFRAPRDESHNDEALHGREASRAFILTLAYNRATGERVRVLATTSLADQAALLAARGLDPGPGTALAPANLADLPELSMQREGCLVVQLAFVGVVILWTALGGLGLVGAWLVRRVRRSGQGR